MGVVGGWPSVCMCGLGVEQGEPRTLPLSDPLLTVGAATVRVYASTSGMLSDGR